jgi:hypothetical protein
MHSAFKIFWICIQQPTVLKAISLAFNGIPTFKQLPVVFFSQYFLIFDNFFYSVQKQIRDKPEKP